MATDPEPLELPADEQNERGLALVDRSVETLFELPGARVRGTLCRYEDERARTALREASDGAIDHPVRFFATTRLGFEPPLPPGVTPAMVLPTLRSEARRNFKRRLEDRGLVDVERKGRERIRIGRRTRVRLIRYAATDPLPESDGELPLECWLGVWTDGSVNVVTSGYPRVALADAFGLDTEDPALTRAGDEYRSAFRSLIGELG